MKGVILGIARASFEAEDLISSEVGSSHDTTPKNWYLSLTVCDGELGERTEAAMINADYTFNNKFFASRVALQKFFSVSNL